jgi:tRNA (mo5U34)-methyltransferase
MGERFDVALCLGILHRVTDPIALLGRSQMYWHRAARSCSRLTARAWPPTPRRSRFTRAGDVYARDDFVYWGFTSEGLSRLGRIVGLDELEVVDELEIDGHPRILAVLRAAGGPRRAISGCPRPRTSPSRILRSGLT